MDINQLKPEEIKLDLCNNSNDFVLYDWYVENEYQGQIEIHFDEGVFSDTIIYTSNSNKDENYDFEWKDVRNYAVYKFIRENSILDYCRD